MKVKQLKEVNCNQEIRIFYLLLTLHFNDILQKKKSILKDSAQLLEKYLEQASITEAVPQCYIYLSETPTK